MKPKKSFMGLILIILAFNIFIVFSWAEFINIYEDKSSEKLSRGVAYERILRFTDRGWLNLNVLRINLKDKYTSLDVLVSEKGISDRDSLEGFTSTSESAGKILGAVNGDFYDTRAYSTIGPVVRDGNLITSSKNCPEFAVFNIDSEGNPFINYWTNNTQKLTNMKNKYILDIKYKNKSYVDKGVILLDKAWGKASFGKEKHGNIVEMVIVENRVKEIRDNLEAVEIPEDGYIIAAAGLTKKYILNNFEEDDNVTLEILSEPDYKGLDLAMGGGAVILKDGKIPYDFTLEISGKYSRTALGISQDKKEVIILAIDGRSSSYLGVEQKELAEILLELGAHDGINLDGGVSTGMTVRYPGEKDLTLVGGRNRRVMNGLAVLNNGPETSLKEIKIDCDDKNIFVGASREFTIKGLDKNYNPVEIDIDKVKWSVQSIEGKFIKNRFIPNTDGKGTLTAVYKGKTASIDIRALDNPVSIKIFPSQTYAEAVDSEGYRAKIALDDLNQFIPDHIENIKNPKKAPSDVLEISLKDNTQSLDKRNTYVDLKNEASFRFLAYGSIGSIDTLLDNLVINKLADISKNMEYNLFVNQVDSKLIDKLSDNYMTAASGYSHVKLKNSSFIKLDNSKGSIRATDYKQWIWLLDTVSSIDSDSLFVVLPQTLSFEDELEEKLFLDTFKKLREEKNMDIWIFAGGSNRDFEIKAVDGIRFVKLQDYPKHNSIDIFNELKYMVFTVNDGYVTYEIENFYEK